MRQDLMVQLDSFVTIHKNALITVQSSRKYNPVVKRCQIVQYPEKNHLRNLNQTHFKKANLKEQYVYIWKLQTLGKSRDLKKPVPAVLFQHRFIIFFVRNITEDSGILKSTVMRKVSK